MKEELQRHYFIRAILYLIERGLIACDGASQEDLGRTVEAFQEQQPTGRLLLSDLAKTWEQGTVGKVWVHRDLHAEYRQAVRLMMIADQQQDDAKPGVKH